MSAEVRMPFGRYGDWPLTEVPTSYLAWLRTIGLRPWLRCAVEEEYERRVGHERDREVAQPTILLTDDVRAAAEEILGRGFRALAAEHHPDRGGDHERMVLLNRAVEALRDVLRGAA